MYDKMEHYCLEDDHIVNLFSFSKAYGMMGWRVGYVSVPCSFLSFAYASVAVIGVNTEPFQFHISCPAQVL